MSEIKLTKAQKRDLERIRKNPVIVSTRGGKCLANGESIDAGILQRLINKGAVIPAGDGLIDGFSQSWRAAE